MHVPPFAGLDSLADLGARSGIDTRPTLLRVLTDLYVQKPSHTPAEDRQYTELALRLMESVDVATRATVAARLAAHPFAPAEVLARLQRSLPEEWRTPPGDARAALPPASIAARDDTSLAAAPSSSIETGWPAFATAHELNELFFAASTEERRLIVLNLQVAGPPPQPLRISRDPHACARLEVAALGRNTREFVHHLAHALHMAPEQAERIARDASGEPIVVAAKALQMPAAMLQRILLFLDPAIGHSIERVHALAMLYDEMSPQAADHMLSLWQSLQPSARTRAVHQPVLGDDEHARSAQVTMSSKKLRPLRSSTSTIQTSGSNRVSRAR